MATAFRALVFWAAMLLPWLVASTSHAADEPIRFARIYKLSGEVIAENGSTGIVRALKAGDTVFVGEKIQTQSASNAVLRTDDAGVIALRPNAAFTMTAFRAQSPEGDRFHIKILVGAVRLITGMIGLKKKTDYLVTTPTATMGIRGTDHEAFVVDTSLAKLLQHPEGTYNKVNRGGVVLLAADTALPIDAGQVGFAPAQPSTRLHRGLLTLLLPRLLDVVPGFFVPGQFDSELAQYAQDNLNEVLGNPSSTPAEQAKDPEETVRSTQEPLATPPKNTDHLPLSPYLVNAVCRPDEIAKAWLAEMDDAIGKRAPERLLELFAAHTVVRATVRTTSGGSADATFTREEFARSTEMSMQQISQFESQRVAIKVTATPTLPSKPCTSIDIESEVNESGSRNGQVYKFTSTENYTLVFDNGRWRAMLASTRQK